MKRRTFSPDWALFLKQANICLCKLCLQLLLPSDQHGFRCIFTVISQSKNCRVPKGFSLLNCSGECCCRGRRVERETELWAEVPGPARVSPTWRNAVVWVYQLHQANWPLFNILFWPLVSLTRNLIVVKFLRNGETENACSYLLCFSLSKSKTKWKERAGED